MFSISKQLNSDHPKMTYFTKVHKTTFTQKPDFLPNDSSPKHNIQKQKSNSIQFILTPPRIYPRSSKS